MSSGGSTQKNRTNINSENRYKAGETKDLLILLSLINSDIES